MNKNKTLLSENYFDQNIYEKEKTNIFYRNWCYVGHTSQIENAGDYLTTDIADESLIIIHTDSGELKGFYNVCRHRAHPLLSDNGNVRSITCPYHAWNYSINGKLKHAKNADKMKDFKKSDYCLSSFQVIDICNFIFVNLDDSAEHLSEQVEGFEEDLKEKVPFLDRLRALPVDKKRPSTVKANWKIVVDNYLECYHCTKAHPAFANLIDMKHYQTDVYSFWSRQYAPITNPDSNAYKFDKKSPVQDMCFWFIWPNTALGYVPGVEALFFSSIRPDGIGNTTRFGHWLVTDDTVLPDGFIDYMNRVLFTEDISICEAVQKGMKSKSYRNGPFMIDPDHSGISETAVQSFHALFRKTLSMDSESG